MYIQVRAFNQPYSGTYTPGRFWPNGELRRLEVVPDAVAEKQLGPDRRPDPAARAIRIAEGPWLDAACKEPDPSRITESGAEAIRNNPRLSTAGDEAVQAASSQAAVDAAKAAAAKASGELVDAHAYIAELELENKKLSKDKVDLLAEVDDLKAKLAKAQAKTPVADKPAPAAPATGEAPKA